MLGEPFLYRRFSSSPPTTLTLGLKEAPAQAFLGPSFPATSKPPERGFPEDKGKAKGILGLGLMLNLPNKQFPADQVKNTSGARIKDQILPL